MLSRQELERLKAKEKRNRAAYRRIFVVLAVTVPLALTFTVADIGWVPVQPGLATVTGMRETWTFKHGQRCMVDVVTNLGPTYYYRLGLCSKSGLSIGQTANVTLKVSRLTRGIFLYGTDPIEAGSRPPFGPPVIPR